jgi:hypothetical protein
MSDDDDIKYTVHRFPMLDTGIGREAGYASDAEFIDAIEAERALLSEILRQQIEEFQRRETLAFLFGTNPKS